MSEVIKCWIFEQLGIVLEHEPWDPGAAGLLIGKLLYRYDLINCDHLKSMQTRDENYEQTTEYIRATINNLDIELSSNDLVDVLKGKNAKAIILFYELYLALHDKNRMHFTAERKIKQNIKEFPQKFKVEKVVDQCSEDEKFNNALSMDLINNEDLIEWHKARLHNIIEKCKLSREGCLNHLQNNELNQAEITCKPKATIEMPKSKEDKLCSDAQTLNLTLDELLDEEERAKMLSDIVPDPMISKKIMNSIRQKHCVEYARKHQQECIQRMLLKELCDKMLGEQKEYFDGEFRTKMLKQSVFEEQMVSKLFEIRQQKDRMQENKHTLMECIRLEEEKRFLLNMMKTNRQDKDEKRNDYMEHERNLELHERLYAQKLHREAINNYNMCFEAIESIVDIAVYKGGYKDWYGDILPRRKMLDFVNLFIKSMPIFNEFEDATRVLEYEPDKFDEDLENIYIAEIDRENCMDDMSFEEYLNNYWSWETVIFKDIDYDTMKLGLNVVGFIVHRLLLAKYPKKPLPPPPAIPKVNVAVCANGLHDLNYIPDLEKLLQARNIKVIQMIDAMNYCLEVWNMESTTEYMDEVLVADTESAANKTDKRPKRAKPAKKGRKNKKNHNAKHELNKELGKTFSSKSIQTSILFLSEELVLSPAGDLGRLAFEVLNLGEIPNDNLMVAMFVEYLKSLQSIEGWVLINYPQTIKQVAILEEALNCVRLPHIYDIFSVTDSVEDIVDLDSRYIQQNAKIEDEFALKRLSKIVQNPKPSNEPIYDTYLTAYIEIRSTESDNIEEQYYDSFRTVQNDNIMNRFYIDQGCKYTLFYEEMDFPTVKHLGKLILGEYTIPPKTSVELFTDSVKYVEAKFENLIDKSVIEKFDEKKAPKKIVYRKRDEEKISEKHSKHSKQSKRSKRSKRSKSSKRSKGKSVIIDIPRVSIYHEDKETQAPGIEEPEFSIEEVSQEEPIPGEEWWSYMKIPIPEEFMIAMASIWENMETVYVIDMKQLFFRKRVLLDTCAPYKKFVQTIMNNHMERPNDNQLYLHDFQVCYNALDDDMRNDVEVKAEFHMRIHEFREKLYEQCDLFVQEIDMERERIIKQNWATNLLIELTNIYITFMQLEIDRCSDSMQMLNDYYTCMVTQYPCLERPLDKHKVETIPQPNNLEFEEHSKSYANYMENTLVARDNISYNTPFHSLLAKNQKVCLTKTGDYRKATQAVYDHLESLLIPKLKSTKGAKKGAKGKKATGIMIFEPVADVKDRAVQVLQEFQTAYLGEIARAQYKLHAIGYVAERNVEEVIHYTIDMFLQLSIGNDLRYKNQLISINTACDIFSNAVEEETKIQPELLFIGDQFYIKLDSVLYESKLPEEPLPPCEAEPMGFTITQLIRFWDILLSLAPTGQIPERSFTFLLQDLLVTKIEDGKPTMVPKLWQALLPHDTHKLMQEMFGDTEYVDWRDFIVYNLGVRFPNEDELLQTRNSFRKLDPDHTELVYEHQCGDIAFWFDYDDDVDDPEEQCRLKMVREFLMKLYKIDENRINYTALLLSFCKDDNPLAGLAKAIELSTGKYVCWKKEQGTSYYNWLCEEVLKSRTEDVDNEFMVDETLGEVVDSTVHKSTSTYFEDYVDDLSAANAEFIEDKEPEVVEVKEPEVVEVKEPVVIENKEDKLEDFFNYFCETTRNVSDFEEYQSSPSTIFTNLSQGRESTEKIIEYYLDFETLINVLTVALPWHAQIKNIDNSSFRDRVALIYQSKLNKECNRVFTYQLFNEPNFVTLLNSVYKFKVKYPKEIIKKLICKV